eukprot:5887599-Amphidinium_carterae.1
MPWMSAPFDEWSSRSRSCMTCLGMVATAASHVLRLLQASTELSTFIEKQQEIPASMPRAWFKPFCTHTFSLRTACCAWQHGLSAVDCEGYRYSRAFEQFERRALTEHPLAGWLRKGALSTGHLAYQTALERGW